VLALADPGKRHHPIRVVGREAATNLREVGCAVLAKLGSHLNRVDGRDQQFVETLWDRLATEVWRGEGVNADNVPAGARLAKPSRNTSPGRQDCRWRACGHARSRRAIPRPSRSLPECRTPRRAL